MTEIWDSDNGEEYGPIGDDAWVVDSLYEVPIGLAEGRADLSLSTCHVLVNRYAIPAKEKYIFPFEVEQIMNESEQWDSVLN